MGLKNKKSAYREGVNKWGQVVYSDYRYWLFLKPGVPSKAGSSTVKFGLLRREHLGPPSSCRIIWNKEGFFIRGWPPGTHPLASPTRRHRGCVHCFVRFLLVTPCLSVGNGTFSCWWKWDQYHLQTSQTKGFRRGQSCCFKLDFFCLCDLWIFLYSVFCPCKHRKLKTNLIKFFSRCNIMCILFNWKVFEF